MTELAIVVDENDAVLRFQDRSTLDSAVDRWRNTAIALFNDKNQILLAKRHPCKKAHPNLWAISASGTVESHETYEQNAYKELLEELGIKDVLLKSAGSHIIDFGDQKRYCGVFVGNYNQSIEDLTLQPHEVSEVKWFTVAKLKKQTKSNPELFAPGMMHVVSLCMQAKL